MIINPDLHLYKMYSFYRLSKERKVCSETALSVTLQSKSFFTLEGKSHKTALCGSELSSRDQLDCKPVLTRLFFCTRDLIHVSF